MSLTDTGPYATPEAARAAVNHLAEVFTPADYQTGAVRQAQQALLLDTVRAAGVELGAYDARILDWLIGMLDWSQTAVFVGLIERAHAAGRQDTTP